MGVTWRTMQWLLSLPLQIIIKTEEKYGNIESMIPISLLNKALKKDKLTSTSLSRQMCLLNGQLIVRCILFTVRCPMTESHSTIGLTMDLLQQIEMKARISQIREILFLEKIIQTVHEEQYTNLF